MDQSADLSFVAPMPTLRRFTVVPRLPPSLEHLREIAHNLWWAWEPLARELFDRIDLDLWEEVHGNPIELLSRIGQQRLDELASDDAFVSHLETVHERYRHYMSREGWFSKRFPEAATSRIAYFSMEYGLHQSLPIYSGGLGVLAGDHLKTASDLGLPLVGVGLAYAEGYFRQVLNDDGWQGERYPINDWHRLPVQPVLDAKRQAADHPRHVPARRRLRAALARAGRARAPVPSRLEPRARTRPPIARSPARSTAATKSFACARRSCWASAAFTPSRRSASRRRVCHMNEGHSAFLALERIGRVMRERGVVVPGRERGVPRRQHLHDAHARARRATTPSRPTLVRRYLEPYRAALGISDDELLAPRPRRPAATRRALLDARPRDPTRPTTTTASASSTARSRARCGRGSGPTLPTHEIPIDVDHQRRAHCRRGCATRWARSSRATSARAGPSTPTIRSSGSGLTRFPTPSCGRRTSTGAIAWCSTRATLAARDAPSGGAAAPRRSTLADEVLDPQRAHDRLRPPVRDLQARGAALHATSSA